MRPTQTRFSTNGKHNGQSLDAMAFTFTGQRRADRYRVDVGSNSLWLPMSGYEALVRLVCATLESESGLAGLPRLTIARLRKDIDKVLGGATGKQLIITGAGEEYRLAIPRSQIRRRVGVSRCFFELIALQVITQQQADLLRKRCGKRRLRETGV